MVSNSTTYQQQQNSRSRSTSGGPTQRSMGHGEADLISHQRAASTNNSNNHLDSPFRVLGIALVAEEVGKGASLVFRYPASAPPLKSSESSRSNNFTATSNVPNFTSFPKVEPGNKASGAKSSPDWCDLFFTLPPRVMAKLFRLKKPLCGQPLTLSVGGTIFCCRSVLLMPHNSSAAGNSASLSSDDGEDPSTERSLVLFSVIVALIPYHPTSSIPIAGWYDDSAKPPCAWDNEDSSSSQKQQPNSGASANNVTTSSASLRSVRRVHLSLARLCRVLEREERRCGYVGQQVAMFIKIRHDLNISSSHQEEAIKSSSTGVDIPERKSDSYEKNTVHGKGTESNMEVIAKPSNAGIETIDGNKKPSSSAPPRPRHVRNSSTVPDTAITSVSGTSTHSPSAPQRHVRGSSLSSFSSSMLQGPPSLTGHTGDKTNATSQTTTSNNLPSSNSMWKQSKSKETTGRTTTGTTATSSSVGHSDENEENAQLLIELMMAASPSSSELTSDDDDDPEQNEYRRHNVGNLARELSQTFHALSRNDVGYLPTTAASLLSGRDGIVYINRHLAVPIEAISLNRARLAHEQCAPPSVHIPRRLPSISSSVSGGGVSNIDNLPFLSTVRPYHTLLFPHSSQADLLLTLRSSGNNHTSNGNTPQQLQKLIMMSNPRKSLSDIALDAAVPLYTAIELATYLVDRGVCTVSPVISRSTRFACSCNTSNLRQDSLAFAQRFGPSVPIVLAISALTKSGCTLGDILLSASNTVVGHRIAVSLGLHESPTTSARLSHPHNGMTSYFNGEHSQAATAGHYPVQDVLYSMAVWLRSHFIIVEIKEYLVHLSSSMGGSGNTSHITTPLVAGSSSDEGNRTGSDSLLNRRSRSIFPAEEAMYQEILDAKCLTGNISTVALCWKIGLDNPTSVSQNRKLKRCKEWGVRENRFKVIFRVPSPADDWGAP
eukprot:scaffold951_cov62-Attheya_sp.AAC.1